MWLWAGHLTSLSLFSKNWFAYLSIIFFFWWRERGEYRKLHLNLEVLYLCFFLGPWDEGWFLKIRRNLQEHKMAITKFLGCRAETINLDSFITLHLRSLLIQSQISILLCPIAGWEHVTHNRYCIISQWMPANNVNQHWIVFYFNLVLGFNPFLLKELIHHIWLTLAHR